MRREHAWLKTVAAAHTRQVAVLCEPGVTVRRVTGGTNNALYRVEVGGDLVACKLFVDDERQRARREYGALRVLEATGLDLAPRPLWLDESCSVVPYPTVAYLWLSGTSLGPDLPQQQLAAMINSIQRLHSLRPEDSAGLELADAWFHWFSLDAYLDEIRGILADYGPWLIGTDPQGPGIVGRLNRLVDDCASFVGGSNVDAGRDCVPLRLCGIDTNLANAVWCDDGRLRWVDWEYSGWGDPALDLADFRWQASLDGISSAEHAWLRERYRRPAGDGGFDERLAVWDRLISTRWVLVILRRLWSAHEGPDRVRLTQPPGDVAALRAMLLRFTERAERAALMVG